MGVEMNDNQTRKTKMKTFELPCGTRDNLLWTVVEAGEPKHQPNGGSVTAYLVRSSDYWNVVAAGTKPGESIERVRILKPAKLNEAEARAEFAKYK